MNVVLGIVVLNAIALLVWFLVRSQYGREEAAAPSSASAGPDPELDAEPDAPVPFGYKSQWLAVKAPDPKSVIEALELRDTKPANWRTGMNAAFDGFVFITPRIGEWVLLVAAEMPELSPERRQEWDRLMDPLAARFDVVSYFGSHRVVDYYAWAKFVDGRLVRAFSFIGDQGKVLINLGAPTPEEIRLGHVFSTLPESPLPFDEEREEFPTVPDENDVVALAAKWSINTLDLASLAPNPSSGFVAQIWVGE